MNKIRIVIKEEIENIKFREYAREYTELSDRYVRKASKEKRILYNNEPISMYKRINHKDEIYILLDRLEEQDILPIKMDLDILYEDKYMLVVNKPPFLVVHPTKNNMDNTLLNGIVYYFKESNQNCIARLVNRLDRDTSGLVIIAKSDYAHMRLADYMSKNIIQKTYIAVVHNKMQNKTGIINKKIYRPNNQAIKRIIDKRGKESITYYKVIEEYGEYSFLELILKTGRTHQIRVHLSDYNCPIIGDSLYSSYNDEKLINRQALHAYRLEVPNLDTGEVMNICSNIPSDIEKVIKNINKGGYNEILSNKF